MPGHRPSIKRTFAGGWLSDEDASVMALIWQFEPGPATDGRDHFEAEVIRGVEKIASLRGKSVDEVMRALDEKYGKSLHNSSSTREQAAALAEDPSIPE